MRRFGLSVEREQLHIACFLRKNPDAVLDYHLNSISKLVMSFQYEKRKKPYGFSLRRFFESTRRYNSLPVSFGRPSFDMDEFGNYRPHLVFLWLVNPNKTPTFKTFYTPQSYVYLVFSVKIPGTSQNGQNVHITV